MNEPIKKYSNFFYFRLNIGAHITFSHALFLSHSHRLSLFIYKYKDFPQNMRQTLKLKIIINKLKVEVPNIRKVYL